MSPEEERRYFLEHKADLQEAGYEKNYRVEEVILYEGGIARGTITSSEVTSFYLNRLQEEPKIKRRTKNQNKKL